MGDYGWLLLITLAATLNPVVVISGIALGLLASHWGQCLFALAIAPVAMAIGWSTGLPWSLLITVSPAGLIWAAAAYGAKRAMTSRDDL